MSRHCFTWNEEFRHSGPECTSTGGTPIPVSMLIAYDYDSNYGVTISMNGEISRFHVNGETIRGDIDYHDCLNRVEQWLSAHAEHIGDIILDERHGGREALQPVRGSDPNNVRGWCEK